MNRSGMWWTVQGANAILELLCSIETAQLYGYFDRVREAAALELRAFATNIVDSAIPT